MTVTLEEFDLAERAERLVGDVYGLLSRAFHEDREVAELFHALEQEEIQHAVRVMMLKKGYRADRSGKLKIVLDIDALKELVGEVETIKRDMESGRMEPDLEQALKLMAGLETRFADSCAEVVLRIEDHELREFFAALAEQDRAHALILSNTTQETER